MGFKMSKEIERAIEREVNRRVAERDWIDLSGFFTFVFEFLIIVFVLIFSYEFLKFIINL